MPGAALVRAGGPSSVIRKTIPGKVGRMISCKDASRLISQMQDGSVPLRQWLRIRLHLLWCEACKHFEQQVRFLHRTMERYRQ